MLGCNNCKHFEEYIGQGGDKVLVCQLKKYATMNNWFKQKDLTPGCFVGEEVNETIKILKNDTRTNIRRQ